MNFPTPPRKPVQENNTSTYYLIFLWLIVGAFIHSRLWGDYEIPPEDSLIFFLIDAVVSGVILGAVVLSGKWLMGLFKKK